MKWVLYRSFPSLVLAQTIDNIKIRPLVNNQDPEHKFEDELDTGKGETELLNDIERRNPEDLSEELIGILHKMKQRELPYRGNLQNIRFT